MLSEKVRDIMSLSDKIKKLRIQKNMTQEYVANEMGISRQAYIAYEKGESKPRKKMYIKLAEVFGCDVEYLMHDEISEEKAKTILSISSLAAAVPLAGSMMLGGIVANMKEAEKRREIENQNSEKYTQEQLDDVKSFSAERIRQYNKYLQRFSAIASGLIIAKMAHNGCKFMVGNVLDVGYDCYDGDTVLCLEGSSIDTWLIKYYAFSEDDRQLDKFVKQMTSSAISNLLFLPKDKRRKVSIVVNHKELFEYLLDITKDNSYGGNLSFVYVDTTEVRIVNEVYVASIVDSEELIQVKIV